MRYALLALAITSLTWAQAPQSSGNIQGDLVDSTGAAVSGVSIRAANQSSGASRTTVSDPAGHFRFSVVGEKVLRLEERLGYVHKGIERRFTEFV